MKPINLFDRSLIKNTRQKRLPLFEPYDFLHKEVNERLVLRLEEFNILFKDVLLLSPKTKDITSFFKKKMHKVNLFQIDLTSNNNLTEFFIQGDEEFLPFKADSFDCVVSSLHLHYVNDVPGVLKQVLESLKPGGILLGALFGGETLFELKQSWLYAEMESGVVPHIIPMIHVQQMGNLLTRAGFHLPVVEEERIELTYSHPIRLLKDLQKMGSINPLHERSRKFLGRSTLIKMIDYYMHHFKIEMNQIIASFDVLFFFCVKNNSN